MVGEPPSECWELNLVPHQKQEMISTNKLSLQPRKLIPLLDRFIWELKKAFTQVVSKDIQVLPQQK